VGDAAPDFRLPAVDEQVYSLAECRRLGRKVGLFFFRGTW